MLIAKEKRKSHTENSVSYGEFLLAWITALAHSPYSESPPNTVQKKSPLSMISNSFKNCTELSEWMKKMWYIYTMEYYSAIKRNEIESFVETWMDLETVIQSEVRKRKTNTTHIYGT